jgi:hypothetical protein
VIDAARASHRSPPTCRILRDLTLVRTSFRYLGFMGIKEDPLTGGRLDDAGMAAGALAFFGFFASRLPRC